jgi:SPP1 gp7 family putative phage head morphogenesis protein
MDTDDAEYADTIYDSQEILAEVGFSQGKAILDLTTGFDVVPTATLKRLRESANDFGDRINLQERDALRLALTKAFEEGASVAETKTLLRLTFHEGYHALNDQGEVVRRTPTDAWAQMVARTELSQASNSGMMDLYSTAGIQQIQWVASLGQNTCQDCEDADGEVASIGENFPSVDVPFPTAHPSCQCTTAPVDDEIGEFRTGGDEQSAWAARGGRDKSSFEKDFGFTHPIDDE